MLMYDKISFRCHLRKHTIYDLKLAICHSRNTAVMGNDNESFTHLFPYILKQFHDFAAAFAVQISRRYCFVSTINILWLSTQLSSICGQNKSKAAHCPSCFSFTPKLSTLFFDVFNQLRIAADEISIKCLVHRLSVHFHHMCDNLFCECCCTSDSVIAP